MDRQDKRLQFDENGMHVNPRDDRLYGYLLLLAPDKKVTKDINELKDISQVDTAAKMQRV